MEKEIKYKELQRLMKRKKINQKQLGELMGLNPINIHHRMYGDYEFKMREIKFLLNFFDKTFDELFPEVI